LYAGAAGLYEEAAGLYDGEGLYDGAGLYDGVGEYAGAGVYDGDGYDGTEIGVAWAAANRHAETATIYRTRDNINRRYLRRTIFIGFFLRTFRRHFLTLT